MFPKRNALASTDNNMGLSCSWARMDHLWCKASEAGGWAYNIIIDGQEITIV